MSCLSGKTCLITGASGGLGRSIAFKLASQGCSIFLTSRNKKELVNVKKELESIEGIQGKVEYYPADLEVLDEIDLLVDEVRRVFGSLDILINNAAFFQPNPIEATTAVEIDTYMAVNIRAPILFTKHFVPSMREKRWGRIVNICSSSAFNGFQNTSLYCTTKHALLGFSRSMHDELKGANIRCFSISPGSIKTEMGKKVQGQNHDYFIEPEEVAAYIAFVISYDGNLISEEVRLNRMKY